MRRWFRIGGAITLLVVVVALVAGVVYFDRIGEWAFRREILPAAIDRVGRDVRVGEVDVGGRVVVLRDVTVAGAEDGPPLARVSRVAVHYDAWEAVTGEPRIGLVEVSGVRVHAVRSGDGGGALSEILARLRERGGGGGGAGAGRSLRPDRVVVEGVDVDVEDRVRGVTATARDIAAEIVPGEPISASIGHVAIVPRVGPTVSARDVRATADPSDPFGTAAIEVGDGRVSLWTGMSLTGITGTVARRGDGARLSIDLSGGYGGATETLWEASGWIDPRARTGRLDVAAERFTFDRIAHVLEGSMLRDVDDTSLSAALTVEVDPAGARFRGDVSARGVTVAHPWLAAEPVEDVDASGRIVGEFDRLTRALHVSEAEISALGATYDLEGYLWLPGGVDPFTGRVREAPRAGGRLAVEPVKCQAMLEAIPPALTPALDGFELRGEFAADVRIDVDLENLEATHLGGDIGIRDCRVVEAPGRVSAERLSKPFSYRVEVAEDDWIEVVIGPENPDFVPFEDVSPHLVNSLMTTEDNGFFEHRGFVTREFRTALVRDLEAGYFKYGASSITMQMVKNVLLHREKTISRKLQELFLTWYLETELPKERIMEIYLNAIEYGPRIYGIGRASQHYFGKPAGELNPVESAWFSSILPDPKRRYRQYCDGELARWTEGKIGRIIDLMYERDRLSAYDYQFAKVTPLFFDRAHVESRRKCRKRVEEAIENAPSTTPLEDDEDRPAGDDSE